MKMRKLNNLSAEFRGAASVAIATATEVSSSLPYPNRYEKAWTDKLMSLISRSGDPT
jgi:hypothetical protein